MKRRTENISKMIEEYSKTRKITRICPICQKDCEPSELRSVKVYCPNCEKDVIVLLFPYI